MSKSGHKFDTIFRHASEDRVNEVHLEIVAKFDSYRRFERERSDAELLLQLR